jgi:hypothetical protein
MGVWECKMRQAVVGSRGDPYDNCWVVVRAGMYMVVDSIASYIWRSD